MLKILYLFMSPQRNLQILGQYIFLMLMKKKENTSSLLMNYTNFLMVFVICVLNE